jgi:endonuclease/exonuclease/phosphatase family metal-dependent hydrolase
MAVIVVALPFSARAQSLPGGPRCGAEGSKIAARSASTLRVATLNVLHGLTQDPPLYPATSTLDQRLELDARQLAQAAVDLVGVQEASETIANKLTHHRSGNVAQRLAARLAQLTRARWHWCWYLSNPRFPAEPDSQAGGGGPLSNQLAALTSSHYASFKEGEAVLSRYPIVDAAGLRLTPNSPTENAFCPKDAPDDVAGCAEAIAIGTREALWAKVATPGGSTQILTAHLENDPGNETGVTPLEQAETALAYADARAAADPPARRFFTCDCNIEAGSAIPAVQLVTVAGWTDTFRNMNPQDPGFTNGIDVIVTPQPRRPFMSARIDYVFARAGTCALHLARSRIIVDQPMKFGRAYWLWPSDHKGVMTELGVAGCR